MALVTQLRTHFLDLRLYDLTQSPSSRVRMQSLRLLVNLSTNEEMVPHLLSARVRSLYRVTRLLGNNLPLTWIWNVPLS